MTGYRMLPANDPVENMLRRQWYEARAEGGQAFEVANLRLASYLWQRAQDDAAADRKRYPKAKRNMPVGSGGGGRVLP